MSCASSGSLAGLQWPQPSALPALTRKIALRKREGDRITTGTASATNIVAEFNFQGPTPALVESRLLEFTPTLKLSEESSFASFKGVRKAARRSNRSPSPSITSATVLNQTKTLVNGFITDLPTVFTKHRVDYLQYIGSPAAAWYGFKLWTFVPVHPLFCFLHSGVSPDRTDSAELSTSMPTLVTLAVLVLGFVDERRMGSVHVVLGGSAAGMVVPSSPLLSLLLGLLSSLVLVAKANTSRPLFQSGRVWSRTSHWIS